MVSAISAILFPSAVSPGPPQSMLMLYLYIYFAIAVLSLHVSYLNFNAGRCCLFAGDSVIFNEQGGEN